ncbi:predicted protein [Naegleria gruberi]|uniref:Predicted protein n=1 Tax=Naegleria gruberi TaxID=5762 RepID=D2V3F3_NAEGR|nr:uncharacterized protein NAEGRDRAFT_63337 [Naegleria gruberi]EFC48761.1 predicted protein [Naegleria gruberi]|eukprot:XP_002681505.1 predicted protein [Naegleria gruberi strain NEG-M]
MSLKSKIKSSPESITLSTFKNEIKNEIHESIIGIWFRNDLRIHDNEALYYAIKKAKKENKKLLPIYIFDKSQSQLPSPFSISKIPNSFTLFEQNFEKEIENICNRNNINFIKKWSSTLIHKNDLPYTDLPNQIPKVFSAFRKKIEKAIDEKDIEIECYEIEKEDYEELLLSEEEINKIHSQFSKNSNLITKLENVNEFMKEYLYPDMEKTQFDNEIKYDQRSVVKFIGGEDKALKRCKFYIENKLKNYSTTRNGNIGDYSTKLSPWLANGCISSRYIYTEIQKNSNEKSKSSANILVSELLWRDFYKYLAWKMGNSFFYEKALQPNKELDYEWEVPLNEYKNERFQQWCKGKTGYPFVDACMRELLNTGFMNNRGRMVVASFLIKDMKIDWRMGAEYFERQLLDSTDSCSNYGNWAWSAGIGCDFRPRYFNPIKQGLDHDKNGEFIKIWIHELASVPSKSIHLPYITLDEDEKKRYKIPSYYSNKNKLACIVQLPSTMKRKYESTSSVVATSSSSTDNDTCKPTKKRK